MLLRGHGDDGPRAAPRLPAGRLTLHTVTQAELAADDARWRCERTLPVSMRAAAAAAASAADAAAADAADADAAAATAATAAVAGGAGAPGAPGAPGAAGAAGAAEQGVGEQGVVVLTYATRSTAMLCDSLKVALPLTLPLPLTLAPIPNPSLNL